MPLRFLIIDGFNFIRRIFEAHAGPDIGDAVAVAQASLQRAINRHNPTHAALVLEHHDTTWRHLLYPEYKANRSPTPPLLLQQLDTFSAAFRQLGVTTVAIPGYEADDVVATIAAVVAKHQGQALILSTDRIYLQLLSPRIRVFNHFADQELDAAWLEQQYGIQVDQYLDYLALVGESSNNIKGVPGIGKKTAAALLHRYQSLEQMLAVTRVQDATLNDAKLNKVRTGAAAARACQQLVTLKQDVELGMNLKQFRLHQNDT